MLKHINKLLRATLLLFAAIEIVSGATVNHHGKIEFPTLQRDELMAQSLGDMGATMKCLLELERPELYDKIYNVWNDFFERIQLHPTKPLNPGLSMDILLKKGSVTLKQLQSIDEKCSSLPTACRDDATKSVNNIPKDLTDIGNSLEILATTMRCVLQETADQEQLNRIFDSSFERIHSNYNTFATPLSKIYEEILQMTTEIKKLNGKCEEIEIKDSACIH